MLKQLALTTLLVSACSSTTFQTTWRNPNAQPIKLSGQKVVGLFVSTRPAVRRRAEDAMARELTARGAQGVPAYTVLDDTEIRDQEAARRKLDSLGFSGAVVMRIVGQETQYRYEPGYWWTVPHYRRLWGGYWSYGWRTVYDPGYLAVDRIVSVETLVYSFRQDELVWAGVSRTLDPSRIEDFIGELAAAVSKEMARDGLLAETATEGYDQSHMASDLGLAR